MNATPLDRLAEAYGLQLSYRAESGATQIVADDDKRAVLKVMGIAADSDEAISRSLSRAPKATETTMAAPAGARCHIPDWLARGRAWGVTCQLYGLRSTRNHGIGDFEDLATLAECLGPAGADFIGVNPLHALFTAAPERCSPFSPSNRRFLNPLYIALDRIPGTAARARVDEAKRAALAAGSRIDYPAVAAFKFGALRPLWRRLRDNAGLWTGRSRRDFEAFIKAGGASLMAHARFEALSHYMVAKGKGAGWHQWPEAYRESNGEAVRRFAARNEDKVRFHLWLQWIAEAQLGAAAARARAAGMRIGLYLDFAVGTAPDGSATWADPSLVLSGASIGAPPDSFFAAGQDWGLAPMSPIRLRARGLAPYKREIEPLMRKAGAIRIDHLMGLHRLYWVPHGHSPANGAYVHYPMAAMLEALAGASRAHRSLVIGEDLGTVPKGFSEITQGVGILSCRVLYFERSRFGYRPAAAYPRNAFVSASTHDLPPLAAWWQGKDIALFHDLGLLDREGRARRRAERVVDRAALLARLERESARRRLPVSLPADAGARSWTRSLAVAVHAFLARTPSRLLGLQFEDLSGADFPMNVPGTIDSYPNWRRRAPLSIETVASRALWRAIIEAVADERPRRP